MSKTSNDPSQYRKRSALELRNTSELDAVKTDRPKKTLVDYEKAYVSASFYVDFTRSSSAKRKK